MCILHSRLQQYMHVWNMVWFILDWTTGSGKLILALLWTKQYYIQPSAAYSCPSTCLHRVKKCMYVGLMSGDTKCMCMWPQTKHHHVATVSETLEANPKWSNLLQIHSWGGNEIKEFSLFILWRVTHPTKKMCHLVQLGHTIHWLWISHFPRSSFELWPLFTFFPRLSKKAALLNAGKIKWSCSTWCQWLIWVYNGVKRKWTECCSDSLYLSSFLHWHLFIFARTCANKVLFEVWLQAQKETRQAVI